MKEEDIKDDLLVIAGDNLFGFSLKKFVKFYQKNKCSVVAFRDLKTIDNVRKKYGVGILKENRIVEFQEKPAEPKSSLASTACYLFKKNDLQLISKLFAQGRIDNLGDLIKSLIKDSILHGFVFTEPWFDIGSFESLKEAEVAYKK